jgi:uncharacterized membrane protein YdjX (TVP38/TMEM64 family)
MNWVAAIIVRLASMGPWAPVLFVVAYVLASILLAPAFLLAFAAGAVFGLWRGTLVIFTGAVLGASAVYALASPLAESRVLRRVSRDPRVNSVRAAVANNSLWIMFLLRLSPIVPFVLLNYALALSGVRYRDFALATAGMLPTIIVYVYYGKVVGDVAKVAAGVVPPRGPGYYTVVAVGLIATVLATRSITRAAKRAMAQT